MASVITVTPAASIDRSYYVDSLIPGSVHRASRVTEELAGKGINVGHALSLAGVSVCGFVPLPLHEHERWRTKPWVEPVPSEAPVRVSVTLLEPDGRTTKINQGVPALEIEVWDAILQGVELEMSAETSRFVAMCGALPSHTSGDDVDLKRLKALVNTHGARLVLDTSGPLLRHWSRLGVPDVIKPNAGELAECVGGTLSTLGDVVEAAREVASWGVDTVLVSLGVDGMVGLHGDHVVHAEARPVTVVSTIGAGDASLAGFLAHAVAQPKDFAGAVAHAVSWGSAKVSQDGSQLSSLETLPEVTVSESVDRSRSLLEPV